MSVYNPSIPNSTDILANSQSQFKDNFTQLDTSMDIDHFAFSNNTSDNAKHKHVTNIDNGSHYTVIANEPRLYGTTEVGSNLPVIQYSRYYDTGAAVAGVPTPLTHLQSTAAAINLVASGTTDVFDFTGMTNSMAMLYAYNTSAPTTGKIAAFIMWNGAGFINVLSTGASGLTASFAGGGNVILRLTNGSGGAMNVYWTLDFLRTS